MKRRLIAEQWDKFARLVFKGRQIDPVQRQEMRRAFYAGGQAVMFGVIAALSPDLEPTADDLKVMTDLEQELQEFAQMIAEGRA